MKWYEDMEYCDLKMDIAARRHGIDAMQRRLDSYRLYARRDRCRIDNLRTENEMLRSQIVDWRAVSTCTTIVSIVLGVVLGAGLFAMVVL